MTETENNRKTLSPGEIVDLIAEIKKNSSKNRRLITLKLPRKETVLHTIPAAAEETGVNVRTLRWAVDNDKLPYTPIKGTKGIEKAVDIDDVIRWRDSRDPTKAKAGRKKSAK